MAIFLFVFVLVFVFLCAIVVARFLIISANEFGNLMARLCHFSRL